MKKVDLRNRIDSLENRVSALESQLKSGKDTAGMIVSSWESVLLEFADKFGLDAGELREQVARRKGQK